MTPENRFLARLCQWDMHSGISRRRQRNKVRHVARRRWTQNLPVGCGILPPRLGCLWGKPSFSCTPSNHRLAIEAQ